MAVLILALHCNIFENYTDWFAPFFRCAVPYFFVIGSFFFFQRPTAEKLKKYVKRLLTLYVFWFAASFPLNIVIRRYEFITEKGIVCELLRWLKKILLGSTWMASWYITATVIGTVLVYFLSKIFSNKVLLILAIPIYFMGCLSSAYCYAFPETSLLLIFDQYVSFTFSFLASLIWIVVGKIFAEGGFVKAQRIRGKAYLLLFSFMLLTVENSVTLGLKIQKSHDQLFMLFPTVVLLVVCVLEWDVSFTHITGKQLRFFSIITYCSQGIVIPVSNFIVIHIIRPSAGLFRQILIFIIALAFEIMLAILINNLKDRRILKFLRYSY